MSKNWRISSFNGALLAAYFIPVWTIIAFQIMVSPIHGLYERPNISVALFVSDHLHLAGMATVRFAWLLALGRMTVVAFFASSCFLTRLRSARAAAATRRSASRSRSAACISFASMVMASQVGETAALRLHATELLMLLGTAIVMLVERPAPRSRSSTTRRRPSYPFSSPSSGDDRGRFLDGVVGGGHAAIDRLLQQDFLDVVGGEAALGERRAHMQAEFVPLPERDHGADHQHAPGAMVEMRPGPDIAPGIARDQVLEIGVERIAVGDRFVDPFIAEHLAALGHAVVAAFLVVH